MASIAAKQKNELAGILDSITDDRVRYFYLMLGEALAEATQHQPIRANTSPAHVAEIATRLSGHKAS